MSITVESKKTYYTGIDYFRIIASILVIAIHTAPFANINHIANFMLNDVIARVAVPFFFMTTGFLVLSKTIDDTSKLWNYCKKILKYYLICILIYLPLYTHYGYFESQNIIVKILKSLFLTGMPADHLWFFPALIISAVMINILCRKFNDSIVMLIVIILYLIGGMGDGYYNIIPNNIIKSFLGLILYIFRDTRNGIFFAPMFVYLGLFIAKSHGHKKVKHNLLKLIIFLCIMTFEAKIVKQYARSSNMYFSLPFVMCYLFCLLIKYKKPRKSNFPINEFTLIVYMIHPFIIDGIQFLSKKIGQYDNLMSHKLILFLMIFILSYTFSFFCIKIIEKYRIKYFKK